MANITVRLKDGTVKKFDHKGRAGGSWTVTMRQEGNFVVIKDEFGKETWIPHEDIQEVVSEPHYNNF